MTVATPPVIVEAFAKNGTKNTIPVPSQIMITPGAASFNDGFPPLTMTPINSGGVPFFGADVNGILNMATAHTAWQQGGGQYSWDSGFSSANSGYVLGALLQSSTDPRIFWSNRSAGNTNNPDSVSTNWQAVIGFPRTAREVTAGATIADPRYSGVERTQGNVKRWGCVCDGVTDDTANFQKAVNSVSTTGGGYLFIPADMLITSAVTISNPGTIIEIQAGSTLKVQDGNYIALNVNAQECILKGGRIWGTNNTTPLVTLVKVGHTGVAAPLFTSAGVNYANASKGVVLSNTYQTLCWFNKYSNCDIFVQTTTDGPSADITLNNESFGTSTIGTGYVVDIHSNGTRLVNCYWETTSQTKGSFIARSGTQYFEMLGGRALNSGPFFIDTNVNATVTGHVSQDTYDSVNDYVWRVSGGGGAVFDNCQVVFTNVIASIVGILSSAGMNVTGCTFKKCAFGVFGGLQGTVSGNTFDSCTVGYQAGTGGAAIVSSNTFSNCTTGVVGTGTAAFTLGKNQYVSNGTNINVAGVPTVIIEEANSGVTTSVADGGTITHNHVKTPTSVRVTGSGADIVTVDSASIGATTFAVKIKTGAGAPGTAQTIYWDCSG